MNKIYDEFNDFNFTAIENILKKYKDIIDISEINEAIENFYEFDFDKVFKILEKCNPSLSTTKAFNQAKDFNFLELTKILSALEKKLIKEVDGDKTKENLIKKFILKIMKKANLIINLIISFINNKKSFLLKMIYRFNIFKISKESNRILLI